MPVDKSGEGTRPRPQPQPPIRSVDHVAVHGGADAPVHDVVRGRERVEVDPIALRRSTVWPGDEEVAGIDGAQPFHHRPHLSRWQRLDRPVEPLPAGDQPGRVIGRMEQPVHKHQSGSIDQLQAVVDGVAAFAPMQKGVHQAGVEVQVRRDAEVGLRKVTGRQGGERLLDDV